MEHIDYLDAVMNSIIVEDTFSFHQILQELKYEEPFEAALTLAQGFAAADRRRYEKYVNYALCEKPEWGTIMREGYGQPLFRQFFRSGARECMTKYLEVMGSRITDILPQLIRDAHTWHQETLDQLDVLPEVLPFRFIQGKMIDNYIIDCGDFEDIMPIIESHDVAVRQRIIL